MIMDLKYIFKGLQALSKNDLLIVIDPGKSENIIRPKI